MLFSKINLILSRVSRFILVNGPGRVVVDNHTESVDDLSGFTTFFKNVITTIGDALMNFGEFILRMLARLAYFILTIALNLIDFMNIMIKELSGIAGSYSLSQNASLEESDILFKFLFNELTLKILRNVFIFALLLIIIFTIMAIVKQEWQAHIQGEVKNVKKIFKKVLQAIFTMLIVPIIMIVGIVFSNIVLTSALGALSGGQQNYSIGSHIFASSCYEANRYRQYADEGKKIPIVFDYDGGFENSVESTLPSLPESSTSAYEEQFNAMLESGNFKTGQATFNMFKDETFYSFDSIGESSKYYTIYDGEYLKTKQIEYYTMADFVDYAMLSGGTFYVVNTEELYRTAIEYVYEKANAKVRVNVLTVPDLKADATKEEKEKHEKDLIVSNYLHYVIDNISIYDKDGNNLKYEKGKTQPLNTIEMINQIVEGKLVIDEFEFKILYDKGRAELLKTEGIQNVDFENEAVSVTYKSRAGSTDEVTGAKYIVCRKVQLEEDGTFIYLPVMANESTNGYRFNAPFLASAPNKIDADTGEVLDEKTRAETFLIARGLFTSAGYPTAIREQGNKIVYYRQDPTMPGTLNFAQIFNYQSAEELQNEDDSNSIGGKFNIGDITEFLTGVDIGTLVPDIQINLNFLRAFSKTEVLGAVSDSGRFKVNYSFVGSGFSMENLYDELKINYVVMLVAAALLLKSLFYIIWGLIQRLYEITLLWITFPGFVSKHPLEGAESITASGTAFSIWKERVIERVITLYSIYLSLALVMLLIPIVYKFDFITSFNVNEGSMFVFNILDGDIANLVIKTMFVLVLFSMLNMDPSGGTSGMPALIEQILLWTKQDGGNISQIGLKTMTDVRALSNKAWKTITPWGAVKTVSGKALQVGRDVSGAIPGRAVFDRASDAVRNVTTNKKLDKALKGAQGNLLANGIDDASVSELTKTLDQVTKDHAYVENYERARSDYNRGVGGKDLKRETRGNTAGIENEMAEVAEYGGGGKVPDSVIEQVKNRKKKKPRAKYKEAKDRLDL